jgi:glycosyltransferase involved in cell wall biosynthesis
MATDREPARRGRIERPHEDAVSARALVAFDDVNRVSTWGGIPYFFLQSGRRNGLFQAGVAVHPDRFRRQRLRWNAVRALTLDRPGGFHYSLEYLRDLWADRDEPSGISEYVSHFQPLPPMNAVREPVSYYIDATLRQYIDGYGRSLGKRIRAEVLAREKEAYHASRFVVCMSRWCADDVTDFYGVPPEKVRVILPGANFDEASLPEATGWDGNLSPLRLGLIGIDWERKGGPTLLDAATNLQRMGHSVEVVVIGPQESTLPSHPALRAMGFIDKAREHARFVHLVRSFHFGCLLSSVEASGFFTLECLRLGVPVIVRDVGGLPENVPENAGVVLPAEETGNRLTEELEAVLSEPERYARMRAAAVNAADYYNWDRTAGEFLALLDANGSRSVHTDPSR